MKISMFAVLALLCAPSVFAAGYSLSPLGRVVTDGAATDVLLITNPSATDSKVQVRTYAWSQATGEDVLTPTREILASPAIVDLKPGEKKVIRLMRMKAVGTGEQDYRLKLSEIPGPPDPKATGFGARVMLDVSVPWIYTNASAVPALTAHWQDKKLVITNTGSAAAQLATVGPEGKAPWVAGLLGWVLPGATRSFEIKGKTGSLAITVNGKPQTLAVK